MGFGLRDRKDARHGEILPTEARKVGFLKRTLVGRWADMATPTRTIDKQMAAPEQEARWDEPVMEKVPFWMANVLLALIWFADVILTIMTESQWTNGSTCLVDLFYPYSIGLNLSINQRRRNWARTDVRTDWVEEGAEQGQMSELT